MIPVGGRFDADPFDRDELALDPQQPLDHAL